MAIIYVNKPIREGRVAVVFEIVSKNIFLEKKSIFIMTTYIYIYILNFKKTLCIVQIN